MGRSDKPVRLPPPLYAGTHTVESVDVGTGNAGLWYDKFCNRWQVDAWQTPDERRRKATIPEDPTWADLLRRQSQAARAHDRPTCSVDKLAWIWTVTRQPVGNASLLADFAKRQRELAKSLGGDSLTLKTETRFATGLGREHPIENGFAWHPILGTPHLAGSGVKGLLRAVVRDWEENGGWLADQIFGSDTPFRVGKIICFDAVPILPVQLEADVMTPHYGPYYESKTPHVVPPGDWHNPTPIPFLVVACGQPFQFAIAPRTAEDRAHVARAFDWLRHGLHWLGAGAKTAVGYGRFLSDGTCTVLRGTSAVQDGTAPAARSPDDAPPPTVTNSAVPRRPRYKPGQSVAATRVADPKGKGRLWFEADDGFSGTVVGETPASLVQLNVGQTTRLEVAAALTAGYNFRVPRPPQPGGKPRGGGRGGPQASSKKGGRK